MSRSPRCVFDLSHKTSWPPFLRVCTPQQRHQIIFLYLVVLHPGVTTINIWILWMIPVYGLSSMWDDSQMVTIESYGWFIILFFVQSTFLINLYQYNVKKCAILYFGNRAEIVSTISNISTKWFTHIFISKSSFYSHPLPRKLKIFFSKLWFKSQYFD